MKAALWITAFAIGLCNSASAATPSRRFDRVQRVDVILTDFALTPQRLHLRRGQAYRLRFVNRSSGGHNFSAPSFFAAAQVSPADAGTVSAGKVELGANQSRSVTLIPAAGSYGVACTHFLHTGFGMVGSITVD